MPTPEDEKSLRKMIQYLGHLGTLTIYMDDSRLSYVGEFEPDDADRYDLAAGDNANLVECVYEIYAAIRE